jgi:hypothetical protein
MTDTVITDERITEAQNMLKTVVDTGLQRGLFGSVDLVQKVATALSIIPQMHARIHELIAHIQLLETKIETYEPPVD